MSHEEFNKLVETRLEEHEDDDLFGAGCCGHFALCALRRGLGELYCLKYPSGDIAHVFILCNDGKAFDRRGKITKDELMQCMTPFSLCPISKSEVEEFNARGHLTETNQKLVFDRAEEIISVILNDIYDR